MALPFGDDDIFGVGAEADDETQGTSGHAHANPFQKGAFSKELRFMLYGFGDSSNPYQDTVDLLERLAVDYMVEMTKRAVDQAKNGRIQVEDILFLIRKDDRKFSRVRELLQMNEQLKRARKQMDEDEIVASIAVSAGTAKVDEKGEAAKTSAMTAVPPSETPSKSHLTDALF